MTWGKRTLLRRVGDRIGSNPPRVPHTLRHHQILGAAYLIALGVLTAFGRGVALGNPGSVTADIAGLRILGRGFVLQAANPKALVFFTALLPQFVDIRTTNVASGALLVAAGTGLALARK